MHTSSSRDATAYSAQITVFVSARSSQDDGGKTELPGEAKLSYLDHMYE